MDIVIEKGTVNDIDELEQLYNDLNDSLTSHINYPGWIKGVYPVRESALSGLSDDNLYVAKHQGTVVGSIILNHIQEEAYKKVVWQVNACDEDILVIHTLVVHPHCKNLGIGKKLMEFAIDLGKLIHHKAIRLDVYEKNIPAIQLYKKCGFSYIDTVDLGLGSYSLLWFQLYERVIK